MLNRVLLDQPAKAWRFHNTLKTFTFEVPKHLQILPFYKKNRGNNWWSPIYSLPSKIFEIQTDFFLWRKHLLF